MHALQSLCRAFLEDLTNHIILLFCASDWIVNNFVLCTIPKISTTFSAHAYIKLSKWIHWTGLEGTKKAKKY